MKFLVDAQLPARLARHLSAAGHDAIHTLDLHDRNRTSDSEISRIADTEGRVVISKDRDFRNDHLIRGTPARLLLVGTGNITNRELIALLQQHLDEIAALFDGASLVQLTATDLSVLDED